MNSVIGGFLVIGILLLFIFIGPFFSIMALNALFGVGIELGFGTWFAMMWLHIVLSSGHSSGKGK